jgi:hypothetical protein
VGKPDWTEWLLDWEASEGSQRNLESFWWGSGGEEASFSGLQEGLALKVGEKGERGMNKQFCLC